MYCYRFVSPMVVICKVSKAAGGMQIREIGIRCDGTFIFGSTLAEMALLEEANPGTHNYMEGQLLDPLLLDRIPEQAYQLLWYQVEEGREGGQTVDSGMNNHHLLKGER